MGQGVCAQLQTGGETEAEKASPQALDGQGCWVRAQAKVHTGHLANLHKLTHETSVMKSLYG